MQYTFQFGAVAQEFPLLLRGAWLTIQLSAGAMFFGLIVGIACAQSRTSKWPVVRRLVQVYVEAIRNTPFLVQVLLLYLGLPSIGIRLLPVHAALLAMIVNVGAYATEIVRAGIQSVALGQVEAGRALGLSPWQVFRFIVLKPALRAVFPSLGSQFILIMLASSVVSVVSAEELTAVTDMIVARNFRSFEFYLTATGMYLAMAFAFQGAFALIDRWLFSPWGNQS